MIDTVSGLKEAARLVGERGWPVTFVDGWETRGRGTLTPGGAVNHWTAGPRAGDHPSLDIVVNGRPGLRNALCNTYSSREPRLYVVAARVAWHAGKGSWRGLSGNSSVLGHEAENSGQGEWTDEHLALIADVDWAQCSVFGYSVEMVCDHFEWTPRKVDRNDVGGPPWRERVRGLLDGDEPDDMEDLMAQFGPPLQIVRDENDRWYLYFRWDEQYAYIATPDALNRLTDRAEKDDRYAETRTDWRSEWLQGAEKVADRK